MTGYLIGDASTLVKPKGRKMAGLGRHYSTTVGQPVVGHSLVQGLQVVLGRRCPLAPQLYRQPAVCAAAGVPFRSKVALMVETIRTFAPLPDTQTPVLVDSWSSAKAVWRAARERGLLITSGLKANRWLRVTDPAAPGGWRWPTLADQAAGLTAADYTVATWPSRQGSHTVSVPVVQTRVRTVYRCPVGIVRERRTAPLSPARYWAASDLAADLPTLLTHLATRWEIEVLFGDLKEGLGLDHYQVMTATALRRFWTLVLAAYVFLEEEQAHGQQPRPGPVTIGATRRAVQRTHQRHLLAWLQQQLRAGATVEDLAAVLAA